VEQPERSRARWVVEKKNPDLTKDEPWRALLNGRRTNDLAEKVGGRGKRTSTGMKRSRSKSENTR